MALLTLFNTTSGYLNNESVHRIEQSPQYDTSRFTGNQKPFSMAWKTHLDMIWRFVTENNQRNPDIPLPGMIFNAPEAVEKGTDELSSIWLGHSTILINIDGYRILTDPILEKKVSIVGPAKFKRDVSTRFQSLPKIDVVVISHDHYDHLNKQSIQQLAKTSDKFVVPLGVGEYLIKWGISEDRIVQLDWWETYNHEQRLNITATPAQHFSGRGLLDRNKTLWTSFVIDSEHHRVFFSGDSGYFDGFKNVGEKFGPFDMTFLECGAYDLMWHQVHMLPEETVQAHQDLKGKVLHPIHWGTFNLAFHPWFEPMRRFVAAANKSGVVFATPVVGESVNPDEKRLGSAWWEIGLNEKNKNLIIADY